MRGTRRSYRHLAAMVCLSLLMVPMSVVDLSTAAAASKPTVCITGKACGAYGALRNSGGLNAR